MPPCYHHLTIDEREQLVVRQAHGWSVRRIAKALHRDPTTRSRELRRNAPPVNVANDRAHRAQERATARTQQAHTYPGLRDGRLRAYLRRMLPRGRSPERIAVMGVEDWEEPRMLGGSRLEPGQPAPRGLKWPATSNSPRSCRSWWRCTRATRWIRPPRRGRFARRAARRSTARWTSPSRTGDCARDPMMPAPTSQRFWPCRRF